MTQRPSITILIAILAPISSACGGEAPDRGLEIVGSYVDDFGGDHDITDDTWTMSGVGVFHIDSYDNEAGFLVAQNDADNDFAPDKWSRMDWTTAGDDLFFCQIAFDAETREDALANEDADRDSLAMGCAGFGWTKLAPQ
jgi:hypothetical protein